MFSPILSDRSTVARAGHQAERDPPEKIRYEGAGSAETWGSRMPDGNHLVAIDTLLAILLTLFASGRVSQMRGKHGIHAPATVGHPEFERAFRAHANTVENLILYVPLLWMAAFFYGGQLPFWVGLVWIVGRVLYITGYTSNDTSKRAPGAYLGYASLAGLAVLTGLGLFGISLMPQV
jgi:glutathione S-transferase